MWGSISAHAVYTSTQHTHIVLCKRLGVEVKITRKKAQSGLIAATRGWRQTELGLVFIKDIYYVRLKKDLTCS